MKMLSTRIISPVQQYIKFYHFSWQKIILVFLIFDRWGTEIQLELLIDAVAIKGIGKK